VKEKINLLWLKRDLRLSDHEPLRLAMSDGLRILLFYAFEPDIISDPHYSDRHHRFIYQSLCDLKKNHPFISLHIFYEKIDTLLDAVQKQYVIARLFSHQETGLQITYDRDVRLKKYCEVKNIDWIEIKTNAITRGRSHRSNWRKEWYEYMSRPIQPIDLDKLTWVQNVDTPPFNPEEHSWTKENKDFQPGGRSYGLRYLQSWLASRHKKYMFTISKPESSRFHCSRLSPYIAYGCLSVREVYQTVKDHKKQYADSVHKRGIEGMLSRLRWQAHFIQKFESEHTMEHETVNAGYGLLQYRDDDKILEAWKIGQTGFPLVDACMRCLQTSGYLNFRMRAMIVSFLTHHLWIFWRQGSEHLAQLFLDFAPDIHYQQFQMQAGLNGTNKIRIYTQITQYQHKDTNRVYHKK